MTDALVRVSTAWIPALASYESVFLALLDDAERRKASRFHFAADRTQYILAHGVLRTILSNETGIAAQALRFGAAEFGKPELLDPDGDVYHGLHFNLSHSGDLIAVATCTTATVGVDVERWTDVEYDLVSETVFSADEQTVLRSLPASQVAEGFFSCWTRKEAYIKATGFGVSQGLDHFDVSLVPGEPARLVEDRRDPRGALGWSMSALAVPTGYSGAVVVGSEMATVEQQSFDARTSLVT